MEEKKMIQVTVDGAEHAYPRGTSLRTVAADFQDRYPCDILLVSRDGKLCELHKTLEQDCSLKMVTALEKPGRQTYERSAVFLMLKAFYDDADWSLFHSPAAAPPAIGVKTRLDFAEPLRDRPARPPGPAAAGHRPSLPAGPRAPGPAAGSRPRAGCGARPRGCGGGPRRPRPLRWPRGPRPSRPWMTPVRSDWAVGALVAVKGLEAAAGGRVSVRGWGDRRGVLW